jgi:heme/copper-type cytochrome/quinol oxidase subunit 2
MKWYTIFMSNTKKIIGVVVIAIVIIAVIAVAWYQYAQRSVSNGGAGSAAVGSGAATVGALTATSSTRTAVPADATVPDKGASSTPANVAVPVVQGVGDPAGNVEYRSFNITIQGGAYSPDTVIVNQGDTVNLDLTAVDATYGFDQPDYGFNTAIPKGKTQTIQFQALQSGNFIFYCASCGGPSKGPVGHIIVVAK